MTKEFRRYIKLPQKASFFLFGPRQVGKTTLIMKQFKDKTLIYNLLDRSLRIRLEKNPSIFKDEIIARDKKKYTHVFIDEIQKFPELLDDIQYLMTSIKNPPYFIMSGSSARKLKKSGVNMLGGRAWSLALSSLTYIEIESGLNREESYFPLLEILEYGSLPAVLNTYSKEDKNMILRSYVETYLEEEIAKESIVRNLNSFYSFLELAGTENGQIINFSNIASDTGVSHTTIKEYYQILEDTLMGFFLRPWTKSTRKKLTKHPKFYFFDTGVQKALSRNYSLSINDKKTNLGKIFEHFIIKEIITLSKYKQNDYKFSFYRTEAGAEVDLIVETPSLQTFAIEIKSTNKISLNDLRGLQSFQEVCNKAKLICVDMDAGNKRYMDNVLILSWKEAIAYILGH